MQIAFLMIPILAIVLIASHRLNGTLNSCRRSIHHQPPSCIRYHSYCCQILLRKDDGDAKVSEDVRRLKVLSSLIIILYLAVLLLCTILIRCADIDGSYYKTVSAIALAVILVQPTDLFIRAVITRIDLGYFPEFVALPPTDGETSWRKDDSPGWIVGDLERLLMLAFMFVGQWTLIGFVVTAKAIVGYDDLTSKVRGRYRITMLTRTTLSVMIAVIGYILFVDASFL